MLMFYSVQTTNLTFVGNKNIYNKKIEHKHISDTKYHK